MNIWDQVCFLFPSQEPAARTTVVMPLAQRELRPGPLIFHHCSVSRRSEVGQAGFRGWEGQAWAKKLSHSRSLLGLKLPEEDPMG